jgi:hypothetical protein
MTSKEEILRDLDELSPLQQQEVADFIAFLLTRGDKRPAAPKAQSRSLTDDPFIGMWRDREDMKDSVAWVRSLREREWSRRIERADTD